MGVAGAVGALYGPLHGGANEAVLRMLERIGSVENIPKFVEGVKNRKEKMFGFGHRCASPAAHDVLSAARRGLKPSTLPNKAAVCIISCLLPCIAQESAGVVCSDARRTLCMPFTGLLTCMSCSLSCR